MATEIQWLLFAAVLLVALLPGGWRFRSRPWLAGLVCVVGGVTAAAAFGWQTCLSRAARAERNRLASAPRTESPYGYVTSDRCDACHPAEYASWHRSFHRTMTTLAGPDTFKAPQEPVTLRLDGEEYRLERRGEEMWVEVPAGDGGASTRASVSSARQPGVWRRLALITGSHHMQVYWMAGDRGNLQDLFPFSWLLTEQRWVPTRDTFLRDPSKHSPAQHWNLNCIRCHATAGQPRPEDFGRFDTRVGELGIACEACHGPADRHVASQHNPFRRFLEHRKGRSEPALVDPRSLSHQASAQVCGQCHGIKWIPAAEHYNENGFSFRPGDDLDRTTPLVRPSRLDLQPYLREPLRRKPAFLAEHYWADGEVRVSGREFNGLLDSPCYERGEMTCQSCHSMHRYEDADDQLRAGGRGNDMCFTCHPKFRADLEAHTHHLAASSGSLCYNCHMPHTTYGLLKAIRSHRISSPNVNIDVRTGRPNGCNLCHLDQPLSWTAQYLNAWYRQPVPELSPEQAVRSAAVLAALRGDAGVRALMAWHLGWAPAQAASGTDWIAPILGQLLDDPYPAVRFIARRSLGSLPGFPGLPYDFAPAPNERAPARPVVWTAWRSARHSNDASKDRSAVLWHSDGGLDTVTFDRLVQERDDRSMDLQE